MRALAVALVVMATVIPARAESPLVTELHALSTRYHENLPRIEALKTALELDPSFAPAYALGGPIYYEVPGFAGGDLDRSEALFRKGLEIDPHYTNMRLGLARTLWKKGRGADARRELEAVLEEKAPFNLADWTMKDVPDAKALLARIKARG